MNYKNGFLLLVLFFTGLSVSMAQNGYQYSIDLNKVENDKLTVVLSTPTIHKDSILFFLPKMVPGTYAIHNYGAYVENFRAYDKKGKKLEVVQKDKNSWLIKNAKTLNKISYEVNDSWDSPEITEDIFEPAGTNIARDSVFVINTFGFFGFFEQMELLPVELKVQKPKEFYGASSLSRKPSNDKTIDLFTASNYHFLADAPILYAKPDTSSIQLGNAKILVAVNARQTVLSSKEIAEALQPVLQAQKLYLQNSLPVDRYAFLIYFSDDQKLTRYGALEHSYSSLYFLPTFLKKEELLTTLKDAAAHEFFHIITPLNIHSEEIGNFDYMQPKMSKHLWLYEGLTEYAAHHAQVRSGLISIEQYLNRQAQKIYLSKRDFNDSLPFTDLSLGALDKHKDQYVNVYQKGALIGLCLDIQLRSLSGGKYSTQILMKDLSKTYGKTRSFKDEELFEIIGKLSFRSIKQFLLEYVGGSSALPYDSIFKLAGIEYREKDTTYQPEIAFNIGFGVITKTDTLYVANTETQSQLGARIGFQKGDRIIEFNGTPLNLQNYAQIFQEYSQTAKLGDKVSWKVWRKSTGGNWESILLSAVIQNEPIVKPTLKLMSNPSASQKRLLNNWLNQKG